jgi:hypothetical protein
MVQSLTRLAENSRPRKAASAASSVGEIPAAAVLAEQLWLGAEIDDELIDELRSVVAGSVDRDIGLLAGELAQFLSLAGALGEVPAEIPEPYILLDRGE